MKGRNEFVVGNMKPGCFVVIVCLSENRVMCLSSCLIIQTISLLSVNWTSIAGYMEFRRAFDKVSSIMINDPLISYGR